MTTYLHEVTFLKPVRRERAEDYYASDFIQVPAPPREGDLRWRVLACVPWTVNGENGILIYWEREFSDKPTTVGEP